MAQDPWEVVVLSRKHQINEQFVEQLRLLCEAELAGDSMICHDGGFRYSGDFMSMEQDLIAPAGFLDQGAYQDLLENGYIEEVSPVIGRPGGFRVTELGRKVAHDEEL